MSVRVSAVPMPGLVGVVVPVPAVIAAIGLAMHGVCHHGMVVDERGNVPMTFFVDMGDVSSHDEMLAFYSAHGEEIAREARRLAFVPVVQN